jgi:hypothetical protein
VVAVCDWNEDGMRDLLAGDREGYVTLFTETGTGLHSNGHVQRDTNATPVDIDVGTNCHVFVNDWNEDGKKDLIFGQEDPVNGGTIRVFLNIGTNAAPRFESFSLVRAGGAPINRFRCSPGVCDLDADNLKDLIVGIYTGLVMFYKNVGTNAAPVFNVPAETLKTVSGTPITVNDYSRISFADWTGDGDLDMVISGYLGTVFLCENSTVKVEEEATSNEQRAMSLRILQNPTTVRQGIKLLATSHTPHARLQIYDVAGKLVQSLTLCPMPYALCSRPSALCPVALRPGIYFVRLEAPQHGPVVTKKVVVVE